MLRNSCNTDSHVNKGITKTTEWQQSSLPPVQYPLLQTVHSEANAWPLWSSSTIAHTKLRLRSYSAVRGDESDWKFEFHSYLGCRHYSSHHPICNDTLTIWKLHNILAVSYLIIHFLFHYRENLFVAYSIQQHVLNCVSYTSIVLNGRRRTWIWERRKHNLSCIFLQTEEIHYKVQAPGKYTRPSEQQLVIFFDFGNLWLKFERSYFLCSF